MTDTNSSIPERGAVEWWQIRLTRVNDIFSRDPSSLEWNFSGSELRKKYVDQGSLRYPGATENDLAALEKRLGLPLCPAYRALLRASNGFGAFGEHVGRLLPAADVDWFRNRNPDVAGHIEEWLRTNDPSPRYALDSQWREDIPLRSVEITQNYDGCTVILCPDAPNKAGEWQVWSSIVGEYERYETLPDYMDSVTEKLG
jgi:hypothetical protein